jgi:hypothetical protein
MAIGDAKAATSRRVRSDLSKINREVALAGAMIISINSFFLRQSLYRQYEILYII